MQTAAQGMPASVTAMATQVVPTTVREAARGGRVGEGGAMAGKGKAGKVKVKV